MKIEIRKAKLTDTDTIKNYQLNMALETENLKLDHATVAHGVKAVFNDPGKGQYWVAESEGKIVASMLMTPEWSDWRNATVLWFQSVYVLPAYRKHGIFRIMYEHLKKYVNSSDEFGGLRLYVDKTNTTAQKVYEALGMNGDHYRFYEWMKKF